MFLLKIRTRSLIILLALITLISVPTHSVFAVGGEISDQASCEAFGGTWEPDRADQCVITNLVIDADEVLTISSDLTLDIRGTFSINGAVNIRGTINNYGAMNNHGDINLIGDIYTVPQLYNITIGVIINNTDANFNIVDAIFVNSGILINHDGGVIKNDSGQISNSGSLSDGKLIENKGVINIINSGIFNNNDRADLINDGTININSGGTINNWVNANITNSGVINNERGTINNSNGDITNEGTIHSYIFRNRSTGHLTNNGTFNINHLLENVRTITNNGTLVNNGTLENFSHLTTLENNNILINNTGSTITNQGTITNNSGGTIDIKVRSYLDNNQTLTNDGLLNNAGSLNNTNVFTNSNAVFNTGEIINSGEIQNYGPFVSTEGTINNECSGIVIGPSAISGDITDICDYTPPEINYTISGVLGENSWYVSDVTVRWTFSDDESRITDVDGCYREVTYVSDMDWTALRCSATSEGGTNSVTFNIRRDATAPTAYLNIFPAPNTNNWNNTDVTVSFTGSDTLSGLAGCDPPVSLNSEGENQPVSGTCVDLAGNVSPLAAANINIDTTAPDVSVVGVVDGETYILGAVPVVSCDTKDALSGVATYASLTVTGGDGEGVGTFAASCIGATDKAGNFGRSSVTYTVITPADAAMNLKDQVMALDLRKGTDKSLSAKLDAALEALEGFEQDKQAAVEAIEDFINSVKAQQGKKISDSEAAALIEYAEEIIVAINSN